MAAESGFTTVPEPLERALKTMFGAVAQTNINENGNKVERHAEGKSSNAKMSNTRRWSSLISDPGLQKRFDFQQLPNWRNETIPAGFKDRDMKAMFTGSTANASPDLVNIVGYGEPKWYAPRPDRECVVDSNLELCRALESTGKWESMGKTWMNMLCSGSNMLVQNRQLYGDVWFRVLGDPTHPSLLGWPMVLRQVDTAKYWRFDMKTRPQDTPFLHIFALDNWEAVEIMWESPIARAARHGYFCLDGVWAHQASEPEGLLQFAAGRCFFGLKNARLLSLAKELGIEVSPGDTLLERCRKMITSTHVLGPLLNFRFPSPSVKCFS